MLVLFHKSRKEEVKLRLTSPETAVLWQTADALMEPILNDYGTSAALIEVLTNATGKGRFEIHRTSAITNKRWVVKVFKGGTYENGESLGETLALAILDLWDRKVR